MKQNSLRTKAVIVLLSVIIGVCSVNGQNSKPNILHIHADDHRPDGLHALGNPILVTPNLDKIVKKGVVFTHCYTMGAMTGAVCTPSRTMMLTGRSLYRIPGEQSALSNAADTATFLPRIIQAAGYETYHIGKSGNGFPDGLKQFEINMMDKTPGETRAQYCKSMAERAINLLKNRMSKTDRKPFYLYLAPPVPHDPRSAEPQFHKLYDPEKIKLSPAFMPMHPWDNGDMSVRDEQLAPWPRTVKDTKQQNADYYSCITGLDFYVGKVIDELKASGEWDNTIVIFSGDNGLSMGDHGLFGKQNLYEKGGMHVPLVISGPGIKKGKSDALVYLMDLYPTFAEFAGAVLPDGVEGKTLVPILKGEQKKVREILYTAYLSCQRAVTDGEWKLIRYPLVDKTQLFNLKKDPYELNNLAGMPKYTAKQDEMFHLLQLEMTKYADNYPLIVSNPKPAEWIPPVKQK